MRSVVASVVLVIATFAIAGFGAGEEPQQSSGAASSSSEQAAPRTLPADVDPQSLARLPLVKRDEMDEDGKKVYDLFVSPQVRSLAGLQGPYGIWLHSPKAAAREQPLNYYLRYETALGRRLTELAILVTAREVNNQFEWTAHEPAAVKEGLEPQIIDVVRYRKGTDGLGEKEALIISLGRELLGKRKLSSATFAHALKVFGRSGLVDLVALMGDYSSVSTMIEAFDIQLRPDQKPLLPLP